MNTSVLGWGLAMVAVAVGWQAQGWQGVALAVSVTVFWLLLQFSRALRVMRHAADAPVGRLGSAVMLQARLKPGLTMMQVVGMTRSLGRQLDKEADIWRWEDDGGVGLTLFFNQGRLARWDLARPANASAGEPEARPEATAALPPTP